MQICSTTLLPCTSSNSRKDLWSCYRCKSHANTLLQNPHISAFVKTFVLLPYEFTLLQNLKRSFWSCYRRKSLANTLLQNDICNRINCFKFYYPVNLHYSKTDYDCYISKLGFYYLMNLHYSKTSKEDIWSCYQCMYHRTFNCILLYHVPFFRKTYWVPCLCKFVQLPCDFAPLQMFK